jgi:nucleotide-binding universal stress UspA family protein
MRVRRILCPMDFSEFSRRGLEHATAFARWFGAELSILHVHPFLTVVEGDAPYFPCRLPLDAGARAKALGGLEEAAEPARASGVKPDLILLEGDPSDQILRQAHVGEADLIVIGTHGRRGFDRWALGSVAGTVVQNAGCAVLTVPRPSEGSPPPSQAYERILCPVDLCRSEPTLDAAFSIARATRARLTLLHVLEGLPQQQAMAGIAGLDWSDYLGSLEQDAAHWLHQAAARHGAGAGPVDELVLSGAPYRQILKTSGARGVGLIVMGIHGRNALERMWFGSTPLQILRQAACPVLTVRAAGVRSMNEAHAPRGPRLEVLRPLASGHPSHFSTQRG